MASTDWEHAPIQAWRFAEIRRRQRRWTEPTAVVASMIRLGFCFDLLDPDNARDLKAFHDEYIRLRRSQGEPIPENKRRWKYLDKAVFDYAYREIELANAEAGSPARVDSCRGVYIRPGTSGRLWRESWVQHGTCIQLLVRNPDCILGNWLVPPHEFVDHNDRVEEKLAAPRASERMDEVIKVRFVNHDQPKKPPESQS